MENKDQKPTGSDTNGQAASKPSEGTKQGSTPQGGGGGNDGDGGKNGGRDSSQSGGQRD